MSRSIDPITHVLVDLTVIPRIGPAHMIVRLGQDDKDIIEMAAQTLGMNQAEFLRISTVRTAEKVLRDNAGR
jgi:biotin synthase-related radical SAM superfamily protein